MIMLDGDSLEQREHQLLAEIEQLRSENQRLRQRNRDLEIALSTTTEHGDIIEIELHKANVQLKAEVKERIKAESTLQALIDIISRQKTDLEIIVHTVMEHGDVLEHQWYQKFCEVMLLADLDGLTQIANRRRFNEYLEQQWQEMARQGQSLSCILCDIDYFKPYNDTYGHLSGDACLRQVAHCLSHSVQHPSDLVARYGGEEFIVLLPMTEIEGAVKVAQRMQAAIADLQIPHQSSKVHQQITVSIGVASTVPNLHTPMNRLITVADQHLYLAKQRGRNQIIASSNV
jgi:diguanylate cyclase (GGDEF)-like protein